MTYALKGIQAGLGPGEQVPLRREVDEWWFSKNENDLNQRSLFMYALREFQNMDPKEQLSYFGIAGIHGQPLVPWDTKKNKGSWYCAHGTSLFGTWHRPYMLLYEQRLYEVMRDLIPREFATQDQAAMFRAADTWRLPFWDWAAKKPDWDPTNPENPQNVGPVVGLNVPYLLTQKTVYVKSKTGSAVEMPNPMWKYTPPTGKTFGNHGITNEEGEFPLCKSTSRHPRTDGRDPGHKYYEADWVNGETQDWNFIIGELRGAESRFSNTLPETVYRLFTESKNKTPTYQQFGTSGWKTGQPPSKYFSLEGVHNNLHGFIGGDGFMGAVSVAAFDPIFWMHHCNIDRLLAIWLDLYTEKYELWLNTKIPKPDYQNPQPDTALGPFHLDTDGTLYKSADCSKQSALGYTYPELQTWLEKYKTDGVFDKKKYRDAIKTEIELKYSSTGKSALALPANEEIATIHLSNMTAKNMVIENFPPPLVERLEEVKAEHPTPMEPLAQESWKENDYIFNVVYDRFALGGYPYAIRVFLGDVPQTGSLLFDQTPTQLGMVYNFSGPTEARGMGPEGCEYCDKQKAEQALSSGQVILTDYLVENIIKQETLRNIPLRTLNPDEVIPYLKENLHWRVTDQFNADIPREDPRMSDLKVSVAMGKATHYGLASDLSLYEDYRVLWEITENRPAGANPGDLGL